MSEAIFLDRVSKYYKNPLSQKKSLALESVSLSIPEGEAFGFVGPNGAGKSTTIKILTGAITNFSGEARVLGKSVSDPTSRQGVGYVPENPYLNDYLTPFEILSMGVSLHCKKIGDMRRHCLEWLDKFSLAAVADKPIRTFSKGMTQRVALAHALAIRPRLLILDEPLSGLDPIGRREVIDLLMEYRLAGGAVFFSSHVLYDVEKLADRFGLIHQGHLVTLQSPQELALAQSGIFVVTYQALSPLTKDSIELRKNQFCCEAMQNDLPAILNEVLSNKAKLLEVKPKASLESVFVKLVGMHQDAPSKIVVSRD